MGHCIAFACSIWGRVGIVGGLSRTGCQILPNVGQEQGLREPEGIPAKHSGE